MTTDSISADDQGADAITFTPDEQEFASSVGLTLKNTGMWDAEQERGVLRLLRKIASLRPDPLEAAFRKISFIDPAANARLIRNALNDAGYEVVKKGKSA